MCLLYDSLPARILFRLRILYFDAIMNRVGKKINMTILKQISIHELTDFKIGNAEYTEGATGCTVILPTDKGATCGVDIRGGGPANREGGLLNPLAANDSVNAVLLSGGSAFGLEASIGVTKYLEEKGIGFPTDYGVVPIVCQSCLFDLEMHTNAIRPDVSLGYQVCLNAENNNYADGNVGAGCGATCGKAYGSEHMMKTGVGSCAYQLGDVKVGVIVACNSMGDVFDYTNGTQIAGAIDYNTKQFLNCEEALYMMQMQSQLHTNTTIGIVLTNASFNKTQLTKIASMAHDGMARSINPIHTEFDGDTIYAMASGKVKADLNVIGTLAARCFSEAITASVKNSESMYGVLSYKDIH